MPQEFQVLQCYKCKMFQVHIVKASLTWNCKMCGEKQSIEKVHGLGKGKDCRGIVQELNKKMLTSRSESSQEMNQEEEEDEIEEIYVFDSEESLSKRVKLETSAKKDESKTISVDLEESDKSSKSNIFQDDDNGMDTILDF